MLNGQKQVRGTGRGSGKWLSACSYENCSIRADSLCFRHQKLISILPKVTIPFKRYVAATVKVVSNIYERFND